MNIEADIWTLYGEDGEDRTLQGEVLVETIGDEEIVILFRVDGVVVANAVLDRFVAGVLVGQLMHSASEAVKA